MSEPIRVLHVLGGLSLGGAESRIMDIFRTIDRSKVMFDFLVHGDSIECPNENSVDGQGRKPEFYDKEVGELGGRIFVLPRFRLYNYFSYRKAVKAFFAQNHEWKVVHGHMTSTAAIYMPLAKKIGIPLCVAHARSAGVDKGMKGIITRLLRLPLLHIADYCFACSTEAGISTFGKGWKESEKAKVFPNAIDAEKFGYDATIREQIRQQLGVTDCFVLGHVGRFHYAKNHSFLLEVFAAVKKAAAERGTRYVLLLLGEGEGMQAIREMAVDLQVEKDVFFLGNQREIHRYYQAMDFFVFPSHFEGLPGTVVEAQAAGLPCIVSEQITKEVGITALVRFESIKKSPDIWASYILNHAQCERKSKVDVVKEAAFDVLGQTAILEDFYLS